MSFEPSREQPSKDVVGVQAMIPSKSKELAMASEPEEAKEEAPEAEVLARYHEMCVRELASYILTRMRIHKTPYHNLWIEHVHTDNSMIAQAAEAAGDNMRARTTG